MSQDKVDIFVTQPSMPSLEEFTDYLREIWDSKWLTNNGQFHKQLENELCQYLGVPHISLFSNGTLALITALQSLRITGEVITTPYSFVATTHALHWNGIKPVFVDIDPETYNINPDKIEAAITPRTTAIMPVHVYGNPCDDKRIRDIAHRYGLKIIYDAAHAFGVLQDNRTILNFGDLSILSFHATKVFNTFEGGAIISQSIDAKTRIDQLKNFGFVNEETITAPGINAKMNEIQAAFGLLQLKCVDESIEKRKYVDSQYREKLEHVKGLTIPKLNPAVKPNFGYFPVLLDATILRSSRDQVYDHLKQNNVFSRKYFFPLISNLSTYSAFDSSQKENLPVANRVASQVLCLPIYPDLSSQQIDFIVEKILEII